MSDNIIGEINKRYYSDINQFTIMCKDYPVIDISMNDLRYDIINEHLVPFYLKDRIKSTEDITNIKDIKQIVKICRTNENALISWLASRTLSLSRKNAKKILNLLNLDNYNSIEDKARISFTCRSVSVSDDYWIKFESDDNVKWEDINIRNVSLSETIAQMALHGSAITLDGSLNTPELSTHGLYAKAWRRYEDGTLWLHKASDGNKESETEVMISNILDKTNVEHCKYYGGLDNEIYVCKCKCMTNDKLSIVTASEYKTYCMYHKKDFDKEILNIDSNSIYKMRIIDYLICNNDRHLGNWGFYYRPNTMEILGCHPLFDHNKAFNKECMNNRNYTARYSINKKSMRDLAMDAINHVDVKFTEAITEHDFLTKEQYNEFMYRSKELGII